MSIWGILIVQEMEILTKVPRDAEGLAEMLLNPWHGLLSKFLCSFSYQIERTGFQYWCSVTANF